MKKALVLLSGGQDSTTCLMWAIKKWGAEAVDAIGFDYGQKHAIELEQAKKIADMLDVPFEVVDVKGILGKSSLTDHSIDHNTKSENNVSLPASFTAGRNALFLTIAATRAYAKKIQNIVTGVCQTDYSGYPDCRQEFIDAQCITLQRAMDYKFAIHTPLMRLTKAETWKLAADLGFIGSYDPITIIKELTMTDYNGDTTMNEWGMGKNDNPATALRVKGYYEAEANGWLKTKKPMPFS